MGFDLGKFLMDAQGAIGEIAPLGGLVMQGIQNWQSANDPNNIAVHNALNQAVMNGVNGNSPYAWGQAQTRGVGNTAGSFLNSMNSNYGGFIAGMPGHSQPQPEPFRFNLSGGPAHAPSPTPYSPTNAASRGGAQGAGGITPYRRFNAPDESQFQHPAGNLNLQLGPVGQDPIAARFGTHPIMQGVENVLNFLDIPSHADGITSVPQDQLAMVHQGEAIIPKAQNPMAQPPGVQGAPMAPPPMRGILSQSPLQQGPPAQGGWWGQGAFSQQALKNDGSNNGLGYAGPPRPTPTPMAPPPMPGPSSGSFGLSQRPAGGMPPMPAPPAGGYAPGQDAYGVHDPVSFWKSRVAANPGNAGMQQELQSALGRQQQMQQGGSQQGMGQQAMPQSAVPNVNTQAQAVPQSPYTQQFIQQLTTRGNDQIAQGQQQAQNALTEQLAAQGLSGSGFGANAQFQNMLSAQAQRNQLPTNITLDTAQKNFENQMASAGFGLNQQLGLGGLALQQQGQGFNQGLANRQFGLQSQLGQGDLALRQLQNQQGNALAQQQFGLQSELGRGQLGQGQQQIDLASQAQQFGQGMQGRAMNLNELQNAQQYGLANQQFGLQNALGQNQINLGNRGMGLQELQNQQQYGLAQQQQQLADYLGRGNLNLNTQALQTQRDLGFGNLNTNQFQAQTQRDMGMGNLALNQGQQTFNQGTLFPWQQQQAQQQYGLQQQQQDLARQLQQFNTGTQGANGWNFGPAFQQQMQQQEFMNNLAGRNQTFNENIGYGNQQLNAMNSQQSNALNYLQMIMGAGAQDASMGQAAQDNIFHQLGKAGAGTAAGAGGTTNV